MYLYVFLKKQNSFTLVELLIVIGILAIVTAAVVIVLNPAELLKQARDSTRLTDLAAIDNAIRNLQTQADISLGTASTVYVSIPDTSSTCTNLSLPALPTGYTYHCVTADNLRNTNGSGWIPIDFTLSPIQSMASLPIDPTNTTSSGLYYTYIPGGSFELNGILESKKYRAITNDLKTLPGVVAKGTNLNLSPIYNPQGLVGYWTFDEGSGTIARDSSGYGNDGILGSGITRKNRGNGYSVFKDFGINSTAVIVPHSPIISFDKNSDFTILTWAKIIGSSGAYPSYSEEGSVIVKIILGQLLMEYL